MTPSWTRSPTAATPVSRSPRSPDGSSVITKHPGTGGLVLPGTVTAQLLYEIAGPGYANPDAVAHFDTFRLELDGPDRVRISQVGSPPPATAKVAINFLGGYRNTMTLVLTRLDIEEKAAWAEQELFAILGGRDQFADADVRLLRFDRPDAHERAGHRAPADYGQGPRPAQGRRPVLQRDDGAGPRRLRGLPHHDPADAGERVRRLLAGLVPAADVPHTAVLPDGTTVTILPTAPAPVPSTVTVPPSAGASTAAANSSPATPDAACAARGLAHRPRPPGPDLRGPVRRQGRQRERRDLDRDPAAYPWLRGYLTVERLRTLLPECAALDVRRFELPNLSALNFVIAGLLGEGVASSTRPDPQAKGLGEYLRSRSAEIPAALLGRGGGD